MNIKHSQFFLLLCVLLILSGLCGCDKENSTTEIHTPTSKNKTGSAPTTGQNFQATKASWEGIYAGVLPCASCPGIDTWLVLQQKGAQPPQYNLTEVYLEEKDASFQTQGIAHWQDNSTNILILEGEGEQRTLFVDETFVAFLSKDQHSAEASSDYALKKMVFFSGLGQQLILEANRVRVHKEKNKIKVTFPALLNLRNGAAAEHSSLRGNMTLDCNSRQYSMRDVILFVERFGAGKTAVKTSNPETIAQSFVDDTDVFAQAADAYCPVH